MTVPDHFIISVNCLVCDLLRGRVGDRHVCSRDIAPTLSGREVITVKECGDYLGFAMDEAIFDYFAAHYQVWYPQLKGWTRFVRKAANPDDLVAN